MKILAKEWPLKALVIPKVQRALLLLLMSMVLLSCEIIPSQEIVYIDNAPASLVLETVEYRIDERGRIIVPVSVNEQGPYDFILDTAASRSLVYENVRMQLDLQFVNESTTFVHGATLSQERPVLPLESLRVGDLELKNVKSFSLPDPVSSSAKPGGVLGLDFLTNYAIFVSVDTQKLHFGRSGYIPPRRKYVTVPMTYDDLGILDYGLPFLKARLEGREVDALFDLGSESTIVNWAGMNTTGVDIKRFLRGRFSFEGVFSAIPIDARARDVKLSIGRRIWLESNVDVSNLPIFEILKRADSPTIIFSASLLREENMIIDFPAQRLYFQATGKQRQRPKRRNCTTLAPNIIFCN